MGQVFSLTRQGISLGPVTSSPYTRVKRSGHFCHSLHVAMQPGLYLLQPMVESGVQSLRVLDHYEPAFPADCPHLKHCYCSAHRASS